MHALQTISGPGRYFREFAPIADAAQASFRAPAAAAQVETIIAVARKIGDIRSDTR